MSNHTISLLAMLGTWVAGLAIVGAFLQVWATRRQAQTSFEDDLSREYRSIVGSLPAEAFFADERVPLSDETRRAFYRYFDLSNEELFYADLGRVSEQTAKQWRDGIKGNINGLPSFRAAWGEIAHRAPNNYFEDLRALVPPETVFPN